MDNMQFASHNIRLPSNYIFLYLLRSYKCKIFENFNFLKTKFSSEICLISGFSKSTVIPLHSDPIDIVYTASHTKIKHLETPY